MVLPGIPLVLSFLAKNATVVNALAAAEAYGYPRIYRRLLEGMKIINIPVEQRKPIKITIKESIRFPSTAYNVITSSETSNFLLKYLEYTNSHINANIPPFFLIIAKILAKKTPIGRILDLLEKSARKNK